LFWSKRSQINEIILDFRVGERARNGASSNHSENFAASGSESHTADKYKLEAAQGGIIINGN